MGYGNAPWEFKGKALYQLSLVRLEEVRHIVTFLNSYIQIELNGVLYYIPLLY